MSFKEYYKNKLNESTDLDDIGFTYKITLHNDNEDYDISTTVESIKQLEKLIKGLVKFNPVDKDTGVGYDPDGYYSALSKATKSSWDFED